MAEAIEEQSGKQKILAAAEELFASLGFQGTSVNAIAKQANVNKATIYYYFETKQAILDCIMDGFLQSLTQASLTMLRNTNIMGVYTSSLMLSEESVAINNEAGLNRLLTEIDSWLDTMLQFFSEKRDVLRIMVMESIKDGGNESLLFRLSDMLASPGAYQDILTEMGVQRLPENVIILKFFGGFLPIIFYAVCAGAWETHYSMQRDVLRQGMFSLFKMEIVGYFHTMQDALKESCHEGSA